MDSGSNIIVAGGWYDQLALFLFTLPFHTFPLLLEKSYIFIFGLFTAS